MTNTTTNAKLAAILAERNYQLRGLDGHIADGGTYETWRARCDAQEAALDALTDAEMDALLKMDRR